LHRPLILDAADIVLQYPTWFILLCVLTGVVYALGLYYKDNRFREASRKMNWGLGTLRFLTVTIICLLLLEPIIKTTSTESKAPIVVLAHDQSESVGNMSESFKQDYQQKFEALQQQLASEYDLKTYAFGEEVREGIDFEFTDKATNISQFMDEMYDLYSNQNLATIIFASDGIYNQGNNPIYSSGRLGVPIYSVALGDTIPKRDLIVKKVYNNKIAYLGDKFTMQVDVAAVNCKDSKTTLTVSRKGRQLYQKTINIDSEDFFVTEEIILDANAVGVQCYSVSLSTIQGEATDGNNQKDVCMDILDTRQKILILAESPHPDLGAMKRMIEQNQNYEVQITYPNKLEGNLQQYDFLILHQLPSTRNSITEVLNTLQTKNIPHLFIVGTQSNLSAFNQAQNLMTINGRTTQTNEVQAVLNPNFNTFILNSSVNEFIYKYPPLVTPFGDFSASAGSDIILTQKIGSINTEYPLLVMAEERNTKKAVLAGEGIWKWRLNNFMSEQDFNAFDELFGKLIQYLSNKDDKRRFRAFVSNTIYNENEAITIDAELYNSNYERINEPEAQVEITNEKGEKFPFTFNKVGDAYTVNAGFFPVGEYRYEASTSLNGERLVAKGEFTVRSVQLELFATTADHQLLYLMSEKQGGQVVLPQDISTIPELINVQGYAKPVLYDSVKTRSLIHLKWIFFLLLILLTLEWFFRRYMGAY